MDYRAGGDISLLRLDCLLINANPDFISVVVNDTTVKRKLFHNNKICKFGKFIVKIATKSE